MKENNKKDLKKEKKNNKFLWFFIILFSIITAVLVILLFYFWKFIISWQAFFLPLLSVYLYLLIFLIYIMYEKFYKQKQWKKKKYNDLNGLYSKNVKDGFVDYESIIGEIERTIEIFFNYQDKKQYSPNNLLIAGEYGSGKTFVMSNILKDNNFEAEIYYIDLSIIQNQSKTKFSNYLFNEIIKCVSYQDYLNKLFKLKFIKIFSKKLPFNFVNDDFCFESNNKKIIVIDEIDRCEPDNIINTFTILKNYCLNIKNVIFIILLNNNIIKPIIKDYYKVDKNNLSFYESFLEKISSKIIEIDVPISNFHVLDFWKNNAVLKNLKNETNLFVKNNLKKIKNKRNQLKKINNRSFVEKLKIFKYLLNKKQNNKNISILDKNLFEFIQYLGFFKILINLKINKIKELQIIQKQLNIEYNFEYDKYLKFQNLTNSIDHSLTKISILKNKANVDNFRTSKAERYSFLAVDGYDNVYFVVNDYQIFKKINDNSEFLFASFNKEDIIVNLLSVKENKTGKYFLYVALANNQIFKIDYYGRILKFTSFLLRNNNIIISLSSDDIGNLYVSLLNDNSIFKVNISGKKEHLYNINNSNKTNSSILLANKVINNMLFFVKDDDNNIYYIDLLNKQEKVFKEMQIIAIKKILYISELNKFYYVCINSENKMKVIQIFYYFDISHIYTNYGNDDKLITVITATNFISFVVVGENIFYLSVLYNNFYKITYGLNYNYICFLSEHLIDKVLKLSYSEFWVFQDNKMRKMNFFDFYFIKNKMETYNLIYSRSKDVWLETKVQWKDKEQIKKIINSSYELLDSRQNFSLALIFEYEIGKYKIIFDLSNRNLIDFSKFEDIWWKLGQYEGKNKIIANYDQFIHEQIVNLLENKKWEESYQVLIKHLKNLITLKNESKNKINEDNILKNEIELLLDNESLEDSEFEDEQIYFKNIT